MKKQILKILLIKILKNQPEKFQFAIDLKKFNNTCHLINSVLSNHNYFLRVFELKNKFRYLSMKEPKKQNIVRQTSSCLSKKYNCFQVISIEYARKQSKNFKRIYVITVVNLL